MKTEAVVIRSHGGPEVLQRETIDLAEPGAREVRVRVRAVALNHLDLWVRRGLPHLKLEYPHRLGADVVGEVDALGPGARGAKVGDRVVVNPGVSCGVCEQCLSGRDNLCRRYGILGEHTSGGYSRHMVVPDENLLPYPGDMPFTQVAAVPLVFLTAWQMVVVKAKVTPSDTVLVQAAGSGVSTAAIQIAKLHGARVIATAGSDAKAERAKALGADHVVNYQTQDFVAEVKRLTGKRGADVVVEHVGGDVMVKSVLASASGARIVTCGATAGFEPKIDLRHVFFRQIQIIGSTMGAKGTLFPVLEHVRGRAAAPRRRPRPAAVGSAGGAPRARGARGVRQGRARGRLRRRGRREARSHDAGRGARRHGGARARGAPRRRRPRAPPGCSILRSPWGVAEPFARGLVAVALEAALLVGWPIGWALACLRFSELGEARVLETLGRSPHGTVARLMPHGAVFGAGLALVSLVYGHDATAPGRVATELVARARASCAEARAPATYPIPFTDMTWLCAPGRRPLVVGPGPGALSGVLLRPPTRGSQATFAPSSSTTRACSSAAGPAGGRARAQGQPGRRCSCAPVRSRSAAWPRGLGRPRSRRRSAPSSSRPPAGRPASLRPIWCSAARRGRGSPRSS